MRLNTGTLLVGIFAVLFGLVGAYALRAALVRDVSPPPAGPRTINVPLASNDLPAGRKLVLSDMSLVPMTAADVKKAGLPLDTLMISTDQIVGRLIRSELKKGEAFLTTGLYPEGQFPDMSARLAPGFRAFTIPVDDLNAVGGAATVGSFVDVVFRTPGLPGDPARRTAPLPETTVTLLENVEVLAVNRTEPAARPTGDLDIRTFVNRRPDAGSAAIRSVTLAVTPDQANILKAAGGRGEMALQLRNSQENGKQSLGPVTLDKLLGVKQLPELKKMELYRSGGMQVLTYDDNNQFSSHDGSYGGGVLGSSGSQAYGGGLHYYNGNYSRAGGTAIGTGGYVPGAQAPANTMLPYPGLPPRGGNSGANNAPAPINPASAAPNQNTALDPNGLPVGYQSPFFMPYTAFYPTSYGNN